MESLSSLVALEETKASSTHAAPWTAESTFSDAAVTHEASPPSLDTGKRNERHETSFTARSACLQGIPCDDHGAQMKPNIYGAACGEHTQPAPEVVGHDVALPAVGPQGGSLGIEVSTEYVMALQGAGQFNVWEPVLRKVLPSQEHSLLLGQICFDVTDGDQRGSWLLPEELLAEWIASAGEDHEDRQIFTNTPVSEEEQDAIEQVLLQLLESQEEDVENTASRDPSTILGVQPVWLEQLVLRYLYSCSFDTQKTFDLLQSTLSFRRQQLPVLESEVYYELRSLGACYWHGRDRKLRPLLVVSLQRLQQLQRDGGVEEKVTRLIIFCLEFFLRYLCVAGKVESWCILCDLSGGGMDDSAVLPPAMGARPHRVGGACDAFCAQNWYPFRFYPGPFDPEVESSPSAVERGVVRWDSEPALHTRVHPVVHCGVSLHTSILRSRSPDRSISLFRYAAWLRHLPELQLAPTTVVWAKRMVCHHLVAHHKCLIRHLKGNSLETAVDQDGRVCNESATEEPGTLSAVSDTKTCLVTVDASSQSSIEQLSPSSAMRKTPGKMSRACTGQRYPSQRLLGGEISSTASSPPDCLLALLPESIAAHCSESHSFVMEHSLAGYTEVLPAGSFKVMESTARQAMSMFASTSSKACITVIRLHKARFCLITESLSAAALVAGSFSVSSQRRAPLEEQLCSVWQYSSSHARSISMHTTTATSESAAKPRDEAQMARETSAISRVVNVKLQALSNGIIFSKQKCMALLEEGQAAQGLSSLKVTRLFKTQGKNEESLGAALFELNKFYGSCHEPNALAIGCQPSVQLSSDAEKENIGFRRADNSVEKAHCRDRLLSPRHLSEGSSFLSAAGKCGRTIARTCLTMRGSRRNMPDVSLGGSRAPNLRGISEAGTMETPSRLYLEKTYHRIEAEVYPCIQGIKKG
ncbi:hypothetical protein, conserved [Eimeria necatrix]|uniref:CRAL-TRIO domain-containing protein n=1 Tax=Eimeria necatrix TaxID=51315 RepID=U6N2Y6_9EIME|nr:hypothetical protein, conserved [Eimeria necatrix]CDJ70557.1 hypothetical protein, conserved [Eimeria necatrix]